MRATFGDQKARIRDKYSEPLMKTEGVLAPLPLVHRTASLDLFRSGVIGARPSPTAAVEALGDDSHAYFFVGVGVYPKGRYAVLCESGTMPGTYTAFDTGAVASGVAALPAEPATSAALTAREFISQHVGAEEELEEFVSVYVKTHFDSAPKYLRSSQNSQPDRPAYHGLTGGDRRSWTVEVQRPSDVDLESEVTLIIAESVADRNDLIDALPPGSGLRSRVVALPEAGFGRTFTERIATYVWKDRWGVRGANGQA
jgi:hypothetical protein